MITSNQKDSLPLSQKLINQASKKVNSQDTELGMSVATDAIGMSQIEPVGCEYQGNLPGMKEQLF